MLPMSVSRIWTDFYADHPGSFRTSARGSQYHYQHHVHDFRSFEDVPRHKEHFAGTDHCIIQAEVAIMADWTVQSLDIDYPYTRHPQDSYLINLVQHNETGSDFVSSL